jgi:hypothetical protein
MRIGRDGSRQAPVEVRIIFREVRFGDKLSTQYGGVLDVAITFERSLAPRTALHPRGAHRQRERALRMRLSTGCKN